jgi:beta-phosphoglucomutase-like phosphatase (HAD superfamily)
MSHPALRAIIFDFNGVIADDETPHLMAFQQALREEGLHLTKEDYSMKCAGRPSRRYDLMNAWSLKTRSPGSRPLSPPG